jgi:hypothetical protein
MSGNLLFVGSIPCETVEEVFRIWGQRFSDSLVYMPDGEVGDRLHWIDGQAFHVFNGHPAIETLKRPLPDEGGVERFVLTVECKGEAQDPAVQTGNGVGGIHNARPISCRVPGTVFATQM